MENMGRGVGRGSEEERKKRVKRESGTRGRKEEREKERKRERQAVRSRFYIQTNLPSPTPSNSALSSTGFSQNSPLLASFSSRMQTTLTSSNPLTSLNAAYPGRCCLPSTKIVTLLKFLHIFGRRNAHFD